MATVHDEISPAIREWIERQHVFFVASAPLAVDGHVNVSPKGMAGTLAVLGPSTVAYLDLTGSGAETIAHTRQNGRITLMWCAFEGPPRIVRVHGRATVVVDGDESFEALTARFEAHRGRRAVIVVEAVRVSDSCGYSVPLMDYRQDRTRLTQWADNRSETELENYRRTKNTTSIDGLPALGH